MQPEIVERIKNFYRIRYPTSKIFNESKKCGSVSVEPLRESKKKVRPARNANVR